MKYSLSGKLSSFISTFSRTLTIAIAVFSFASGFLMFAQAVSASTTPLTDSQEFARPNPTSVEIQLNHTNIVPGSITGTDATGAAITEDDTTGSLYDHNDELFGTVDYVTGILTTSPSYGGMGVIQTINYSYKQTDAVVSADGALASTTPFTDSQELVSLKTDPIQIVLAHTNIVPGSITGTDATGATITEDDTTGNLYDHNDELLGTLDYKNGILTTGPSYGGMGVIQTINYSYNQADVPVLTPVPIPTLTNVSNGSSGGSFSPIISQVLGTTTPTVPTAGQVLGAATFQFTSPLYKGMSSSDVKQLQDCLRFEGYFTFPTSTGFFGPMTFTAVKAYQADHGIPATGFVGPLTIAKLNIQD